MTDEQIAALAERDVVHRREAGASECALYTVAIASEATVLVSADAHVVVLNAVPLGAARDEFHLPADCPAPH